jgi:hypothetical protein
MPTSNFFCKGEEVGILALEMQITNLKLSFFAKTLLNTIYFY